jgi:hypothetical protein
MTSTHSNSSNNSSHIKFVEMLDVIADYGKSVMETYDELNDGWKITILKFDDVVKPHHNLVLKAFLRYSPYFTRHMKFTLQIKTWDYYNGDNNRNRITILLRICKGLLLNEENINKK